METEVTLSCRKLTAVDAFGNSLGNAILEWMRPEVKAESPVTEPLSETDALVSGIRTTFNKSVEQMAYEMNELSKKQGPFGPSDDQRAINLHAQTLKPLQANLLYVDGENVITDTQLFDYVDNIQANRAAYLKALEEHGAKGGEVYNLLELNEARETEYVTKSNWGDKSVLLAFEEPDMVTSLIYKESGFFSQKTTYLYRYDDDNLSVAMPSFVLNMGEYNDAGIVDGLRQMLTYGGRYLDISDIVESSVKNVRWNYAELTGVDFNEMADRQGIVAPTERFTLAMFDDISKTTVSVDDERLPTFMRDAAQFEMALLAVTAMAGPTISVARKGVDLYQKGYRLRSPVVADNIGQLNSFPAGMKLQNPLHRKTLKEERLILAGDAKRARIVSEIGKEMEPAINAILKLDPDAKIGFRGSLAGGLKGPHKVGPQGERVAYDGQVAKKLNKQTGNYESYHGPSGYDLDFFVVSDKLASKFSRRDWFRNLTAKDRTIREEFAALRDRLNNNPSLDGLKQESIDVRVWTSKQIESKVSNGDPQIYFFTNK